MHIKATSEEHARKIFDELEKKGFRYVMSYLYMQEWRKGDETYLVLKGYGYQHPNYGM